MKRPPIGRPAQILAAMVALLIAALLTAAPAGATAQELPAPAPRSAASVDSLADHGRLQEAAWLAREIGDTARADSLLARLRDILTAPPLRATPQDMRNQGVSYTFRLAHRDGIGSVFKVDGSDIFCRACGADREVAAYAVDRLLGLDLTPMTVRTTIVDEVGDTLSGSTMYFVHGASLPRDVGATKPDRLRFFDAVIGNSDRHQRNWLILPDGRVAAIDHNRAFHYRPSSPPKTCWETEVDAIARPDRLGPPLDRYRALPDDSLAAAVEALEPPLVEEFIAMRDAVIDRIEARTKDPGRDAVYADCAFGDLEGG